MNKNTIEIARSYSRTIQLEPFTPTNVFMSAKAEVTDNNVDTIKILSNELYDLCKKTVDSDIEKLIAEKKEKERIVKELS
jgi:hypothetical protein